MPKKLPYKTREPRIQEKPEFEQKLLDVARTARMVAGGRRFSFRVVVVIGKIFKGLGLILPHSHVLTWGEGFT